MNLYDDFQVKIIGILMGFGCFGMVLEVVLVVMVIVWLAKQIF